MRKSILNKTLILCITALLLNSCVHSKYKEIEVEKEIEAYYDKSIAKQYEIIKDWWKKYNDINLNNLIELGLRNNKDYLIASINVNKELYRLKNETKGLFPTLYGKLNAGTSRSITTSDNFKNTFSGEAGLNYEVDILGKVRDSKNAQKFEYQATVYDQETAKLTLINSIVDLYYNIMYLNSSIGLSTDTLKNYEEIEVIAKEKFNIGKIDSLQLIKAQQNTLTAKNNLINLKTQKNELEKSLRVILNAKPNFEIKISDINILVVKNSKIDLYVSVSALRIRPDIQASEFRVKKALKELQIEEKSLYPSITINGAISSSSSKARTMFDFGTIGGNVAISLPFFDWYTIKNNIKISEEDYKQARLDLTTTVNTALNEVYYYNTLYENTDEIVQNIRQKYKKTQKETEYYENKYLAGSIELTDLLEAKNADNTVKNELLQNKYNCIKYENMIYKAIGGRHIVKNK